MDLQQIIKFEFRSYFFWFASFNFFKMLALLRNGLYIALYDLLLKLRQKAGKG